MSEEFTLLVDNVVRNINDGRSYLFLNFVIALQLEYALDDLHLGGC